MKRLLLSLAVLAFWGCKKTENSNNPQTQDKNTIYTSVQNIVYSSPLKVNSIHPETVKIIQVNGNYHLVTSFADLFGTTYDYFRSFRIDTNSGLLTENTTSLLGEYKEVGFPKSPFYYEDLNGDGIKDLFVADHGKETPSLIVNGQFPGYVNHLFWGNSNGTFSKAAVAELTNIQKFYHNSAVGDIDNDGDKDLVVQSFSNSEMELFINANGTLGKRINIAPQNQTGSIFIADMDTDGITDLVSAPYIDRSATPATYIQKINITNNTFTKTNSSTVRPFGNDFGCYKVIGMPNSNNANKYNFFYFVESGILSQKIFRSKDNDHKQLEEISTVQSTAASNNIRDYLIIDLNFDKLNDILFITNPGEPLNKRVWLNKGGNIFENANWDVNSTLTDFFIPISQNASSGKTKFLYFNPLQSQIIEIYTKK
jgi:hypothetical protein